MDINQTSTAVSYGASARANATAGDTDASADGGASGNMISSDFETFLKMLTVQMENQDPLNPIESSDYAVQLATFSGVEQQVQTNDLLKAVQNQLGVMSMSDLVGWVGMEARAVAPAHFELQPIEVTPDMPSGATQAFMVVRNAAGQQIDRVQIPLSSEPFEWAGMDPSGQLFPEGDYTFHLQSYNATGLLSEEQMAVYSEVVEARVESGRTILVLDGGEEVSAADVDALRSPKG